VILPSRNAAIDRSRCSSHGISSTEFSKSPSLHRQQLRSCQSAHSVPHENAVIVFAPAISLNPCTAMTLAAQAAGSRRRLLVIVNVEHGPTRNAQPGIVWILMSTEIHAWPAGYRALSGAVRLLLSVRGEGFVRTSKWTTKSAVLLK
jgi:hypothetical protein